jgi:hypothetical protein
MTPPRTQAPRPGREQVLHTLLEFVGALAASTVPWAAIAVAGSKALVEFKRHSDEWDPALPKPGADETTVHALERAVLGDPPPGVDREAIQELFGYQTLRRLYPELDGRWLVRTLEGLPLTPFVEEWSAVPDPAQPCVPMRFELQPDEYVLPTVAEALGQRVDELVRHKLRTDEAKIRVRALALRDRELRLTYSACRYSDYLRSHWAVANLEPDAAAELRAQLCGVGRLLPIDESLCPNNLGVSAIVAFEDRIVLPKSTQGVIASPGRRVPSASGGADFMPHHWQSPPSPIQDILREAHEELGIEIADFRHARTRLLGLARNVLRGGKPEAFYCVHLPGRFRGTMASFEHEKDSVVRPLPLLTPHEAPAPDFEDRLRAVERLMRQPSTYADLVSPFTRLALHYYARFARGCWLAQSPR